MSIPYGYVYRIRNKVNGKTYIGQRKLILDKNWRQYMGSGKLIRAAIEKHGIENFNKELLAYAETPESLNVAEIDLMIRERSMGKSEYNLHIGSPVPADNNSFAHMTEEQKRECYEIIAKKNKANNRRKFEAVMELHGDSVISLYAELGSCQKVAKSLEISPKHVNIFLQEANIELNHQSIAGRLLDDGVKRKISESLRKRASEGSSPTKYFEFKCEFCEIEFGDRHSNRKFCSKSCSIAASTKLLPDPETVKILYWDENLSANAIGKIYSVSGQTIRNMMRLNGIEIRAERHRPSSKEKFSSMDQQPSVTLF